MYAVSEGPSRGWTIAADHRARRWPASCCSPASSATSCGHPQPMIDLRLVKNTLFRTTTTVLFIGMAGFLGTLYLVALFFQDGLGLSALGSGLSTFPEAIGVMIGAQFATRLYANFGPRRRDDDRADLSSPR